MDEAGPAGASSGMGRRCAWQWCGLTLSSENSKDAGCEPVLLYCMPPSKTEPSLDKPLPKLGCDDGPKDMLSVAVVTLADSDAPLGMVRSAGGRACSPLRLKGSSGPEWLGLGVGPPLELAWSLLRRRMLPSSPITALSAPPACVEDDADAPEAEAEASGPDWAEWPPCTEPLSEVRAWRSARGAEWDAWDACPPWAPCSEMSSGGPLRLRSCLSLWTPPCRPDEKTGAQVGGGTASWPIICGTCQLPKVLLCPSHQPVVALHPVHAPHG